ncbi:hypothetical protein [Pseudomonas sp. NPDC089569]|uniref:hypothetical protein n=1 Tax=Pseudomonas sp. NPDC089569 TaxID=3390722 RepID=UPI003D04C33D
MTLNQTFETPKHLVDVLEKRPCNKAEFLTFVANWTVYGDFLLSQAKTRKDLPHHPLNTEDGQSKFVAEVTRIQETYNQVSADVRAQKFNLSGAEMRRIGDHFSQTALTMEQAFAIFQMP